MTAGEMPALLWKFGETFESISSAAVNGGVCSIDWLLNIRVPSDYARCDLDQHAEENPTAERARGRSHFV